MILSETEIETYRRDGVVALRGIFKQSWLDRLRSGIERDLADPSPNLVRHSKDASAPAYIEDFWCWEMFPEFEDFVRNSPCGEVAARLLEAPSVNLVMDNWFLREAGSSSRPPFHHDISYFDFEGTMCVLWLPLEPVTKENGIAWVKGSHLWDKLFMRVRFKDGHNLDAEIGEDGSAVVNGLRYEEPPDISANPAAYELLQFDLAAGDCVFFDMRTLHGSLSTVVPEKTVYRYTLRMTAPDGVIKYRGDWAAGERAMFEARGYREGDRIAGEMFPELWSGNK